MIRTSGKRLYGSDKLLGQTLLGQTRSFPKEGREAAITSKVNIERYSTISNVVDIARQSYNIFESSNPYKCSDVIFSMAEKVRTEEFKVSGSGLVDKFKQIIKEGNVRRVIIKNQEGKTLIDVPLTVGTVGGVAFVAIAPILAAIGAIAGLVTKCTLVVERVEK